MLDYDQTLEELQLSSGKPKTTDNLVHTCFLRYENNKVSDIISVETKDFVHCNIKVSYCVNFDIEHQDTWFSVDNYVKFLTDRERSLMKRAIKNYYIEEFYQNYVDIVRSIAVGENGLFFPENGMRVTDCEVLSLNVEDNIAEMLEEHQEEMVAKSLQLSAANKRVQVAEQLAMAEKREIELTNQQSINRLNLQRDEAVRKLEIQTEINRLKEAEAEAAKQAEKDLQAMVDSIADAARERQAKDNEQKLAYENAIAAIEKAKQDAYAETVAKIMSSIGPELAASLSMKANESMVNALTHAVGPYAIAGEESISDVVNKLLRGTPIEAVIDNFKQN